MPGRVQELTDKLLKAIDSEGNVVDMETVEMVVSELEKTRVTAEDLKSTRLGRYINLVRRKISRKHVAHRMKKLIKQWLAQAGQPNGLPTPTGPAPASPPPPPVAPPPVTPPPVTPPTLTTSPPPPAGGAVRESPSANPAAKRMRMMQMLSFVKKPQPVPPLASTSSSTLPSAAATPPLPPSAPPPPLSSVTPGHSVHEHTNGARLSQATPTHPSDTTVPPIHPSSTITSAPPTFSSSTFSSAPPTFSSSTFTSAPPTFPSSTFTSAPPTFPSNTLTSAPPTFPPSILAVAPPTLPPHPPTPTATQSCPSPSPSLPVKSSLESSRLAPSDGVLPSLSPSPLVASVPYPVQSTCSFVVSIPRHVVELSRTQNAAVSVAKPSPGNLSAADETKSRSLPTVASPDSPPLLSLLISIDKSRLLRSGPSAYRRANSKEKRTDRKLSGVFLNTDGSDRIHSDEILRTGGRSRLISERPRSPVLLAPAHTPDGSAAASHSVGVPAGQTLGVDGCIGPDGLWYRWTDAIPGLEPVLTVYPYVYIDGINVTEDELT